MPLNLFYTMVQKSQKWPKTQIKGGPALIAIDTDGFRRMKEEGEIYKTLPQIFLFFLGT